MKMVDTTPINCAPVPIQNLLPCNWMYLSFLKAEDEVYVSHTCQFYEWQHCGVEEVTTADLHSSGWRGPSTWRIYTKCSSMGLLVIMVQLILNPTFNKLMVFDRHIDTSSYLYALPGRLTGQHRDTWWQCCTAWYQICHIQVNCICCNLGKCANGTCVFVLMI